MGAAFITATFPGSLSEQKVSDKVALLVECCERRDAYSGDWNVVQPRCSFPNGRNVLKDSNAAHDFLADHAVKWEGAQAVRYRATVTKLMEVPTFGGEEADHFMINRREVLKVQFGQFRHGTCRDYKVIPCDLLTKEEAEKAERLYRAVSEAQAADAELFHKWRPDRPPQEESRKIWDAQMAAQKEWDDYAKELRKKVYKTRKTRSIKWMVGAWASE